jgi:hypothetical protein
MGRIIINQTAEIRDANIIGARRKLAQCISRAEAPIDFHIKVVAGETSTFHGSRPYRLRTLESPIHDEIDMSGVRSVGCATIQGSTQRKRHKKPLHIKTFLRA